MTAPLVPQKKCPWDGSTPSIDKGLCNRKDLGRRTKSAFAYVRCPVCSVEKGVIAIEGDHDVDAAVREAVRIWDTRVA